MSEDMVEGKRRVAERSEQDRALRRRVKEGRASNAVEAMRRLKGYQRDYVTARAEGMSQPKAWERATGKSDPKGASANRLESYPHVKQAIEAVTTAAVAGSVMTLAQRRDFVLDRLVEESTNAGDSARVRAIELLGKTAGLFVDRVEVSQTDPAAITARLQQLIEQAKGRVIDAQVLDSIDDPDALRLDAASSETPPEG